MRKLSLPTAMQCNFGGGLEFCSVLCHSVIKTKCIYDYDDRFSVVVSEGHACILLQIRYTLAHAITFCGWKINKSRGRSKATLQLLLLWKYIGDTIRRIARFWYTKATLTCCTQSDVTNYSCCLSRRIQYKWNTFSNIRWKVLNIIMGNGMLIGMFIVRSSSYCLHLACGTVSIDILPYFIGACVHPSVSLTNVAETKGYNFSSMR